METINFDYSQEREEKRPKRGPQYSTAEFEILAETIKRCPNNLRYAFEIAAAKIQEQTGITRSAASIEMVYYNNKIFITKYKSMLFVNHSMTTAIAPGRKNSPRWDENTMPEAHQIDLTTKTMVNVSKNTNIVQVIVESGELTVNNISIKGTNIKIQYYK